MPESKPKFNPDYFSAPSLGILIVNIPLIGFHVLACFYADSIPESLWPLNSVILWWSQHLYYLSAAALVFVVVSHSYEAYTAVTLCLEHGMTASATTKWCLMTLYCGVFSLNQQLRPYLEKFKKD